MAASCLVTQMAVRVEAVPARSGPRPLGDPDYPHPDRALSSAVERCLHTAEVTGSKPVAPTNGTATGLRVRRAEAVALASQHLLGIKSVPRGTSATFLPIADSPVMSTSMPARTFVQKVLVIPQLVDLWTNRNATPGMGPSADGPAMDVGRTSIASNADPSSVSTCSRRAASVVSLQCIMRRKWPPGFAHRATLRA